MVMRTMAAAMVVTATIAGGCGTGLRGDGTLAVLEVSDKLHAMTWSTASGYPGGQLVTDTGDMVDAFCAGAHLWDVVGAQVRCRREVEGQSSASSVHVVIADSAWADHDAWYSSGDDEIHFSRMRCDGIDMCAAVAAHEIGHALGMNHIGRGNLMAPSTDATTLQPADIAQFRMAWN